MEMPALLALYILSGPPPGQSGHDWFDWFLIGRGARIQVWTGLSRDSVARSMACAIITSSSITDRGPFWAQLGVKGHI